MQVSVETTGSLERTMKVRVPAEQVEREVDARLKKVARTAKIKGFRPGKIPRKVVEKRYGGQVRQEVLSELLQKSYSEALQQEQLQPAGGPRIETDEAEAGKDFAYTAVFEVFPKIELAKVEGLAFERPTVEIQEEDVDEMLERLRTQRADWGPVERAAAEGDRVKVDFIGRIDGEPFEGGEGKDVPVVLGEGQMLGDFEQGIYGLKPGGSQTVPVTFPSDYRNESLAGKTAEFTVTAIAVEEKILPDVDEEFAKAFGIEDGSLETLRTEVRENMQRELDERIKAQLKRQALDQLVDQNPVELPDSLIQQEIQALQQEAMRRMGTEDPQQAPPADAFRDGARRRVAVGLLINALISRESIQVDPQRVMEQIESMAANYEQPEEVIRLYQSQPRLRSQIEMAVLEEQVTEWLVEHGEVADTPKVFRDFMDG